MSFQRCLALDGVLARSTSCAVSMFGGIECFGNYPNEGDHR